MFLEVGSIVKHIKIVELRKSNKNDIPLFKVVALSEDGTRANVKLYKKASEPFHDFGRTWDNIPVERLEVVEVENKPKKKKRKKKKEKEAS